MEADKGRKVVRRPSSAAKALKQATSPLSPGDWIEFGMTVEFKHPRKGSYWPKFAAGTTIRENETAAEAKSRIVGFVTDTLEEQIDEIKA